MTFFCEINIYLTEQLLEHTTLKSTANRRGQCDKCNISACETRATTTIFQKVNTPSEIFMREKFQVHEFCLSAVILESVICYDPRKPDVT